MAAKAVAILETPSLACPAPGLERFKQLEDGRAGAPWASPSLQGFFTVFPDVSLKVAIHLTCWFRAPEENVPRETRIRCTSLFKLAMEVTPCHFLPLSIHWGRFKDPSRLMEIECRLCLWLSNNLQFFLNH